MARKRKKKVKGTSNPETTPDKPADVLVDPEGFGGSDYAEDEQDRYDSVSVTGSGRDVTAEEPTEALTEPEPEVVIVQSFVYVPSARFEPDAPNFTHREVARSSTADRYNIDNTPNEEVLRNAYALAVNCLMPVRAEFGAFAPNSWYRGEALERVICRQSFIDWCTKYQKPRGVEAWNEYFAKKSHPKGQAADIEIIGVPNDELYKWCVANLTFDQCIREFPKEGDPMSGWVHISYNAGNNRGQAFTIP